MLWLLGLLMGMLLLELLPDFPLLLLGLSSLMWAETMLLSIFLGLYVACCVMNNMVLHLHCRALSLVTPLGPGLTAQGINLVGWPKPAVLFLPLLPTPLDARKHAGNNPDYDYHKILQM